MLLNVFPNMRQIWLVESIKCWLIDYTGYWAESHWNMLTEIVCAYINSL